MRRSRRAAALVLLLVGAVITDALANGYGNAKDLIEQAEKAFDAGKDDEGLSLLDDALYYQTTVGKKKEPYGYARYVLYRLSRYYLEKGNEKKAEKYIKKALKAPEDHDWVDEEYWVSKYDPYIVENFPKLAGMKAKVHPPLRRAGRVAVTGEAGPRRSLSRSRPSSDANWATWSPAASSSTW